MLNERLIMAHQLLREDGVIFVSIDDNEQAYLKVLMDEIFGEENFVCNFVWQKKNEGSADDAKYIKILNEYILMYAKNIEKIETNSLKYEMNDGSYNLKDKYFETRGLYKLKQLDFASLTWSNTLDYPIEYKGKTYYAGSSKEKWEKRIKGQHAIKDWQWRWSKQKVQWGIDNDFIIFKNNKIYTKQYQFVNNNNEIINRATKFSNLILNFHGSIGTQQQKSIFSMKIFDHPKPVELIKYLIDINPNKNARVLDFYAGSGTTGHAVLDLNRKDGGNRTFTLITNNENNIAINVCYERLYRINKGEGTKHEKDFDWIKKNKVFNSNLNVFDINYYNTSIFNIENDNLKIKKIYLDELNDFGINSDLTTLEILRDLTALKPMKKNNNGEEYGIK